LQIVDDIVAFLQGKNPMIAYRIVRGDLIPEGPIFRMEIDRLRRERFGRWGTGDLARHMATLMLQDLTMLLNQTISPLLGMVQYGEKLADSPPSFDALANQAARPRNLVETMMLEAADAAIAADV